MSVAARVIWQPLTTIATPWKRYESQEWVQQEQSSEHGECRGEISVNGRENQENLIKHNKAMGASPYKLSQRTTRQQNNPAGPEERETRKSPFTSNARNVNRIKRVPGLYSQEQDNYDSTMEGCNFTDETNRKLDDGDGRLCVWPTLTEESLPKLLQFALPGRAIHCGWPEKQFRQTVRPTAFLEDRVNAKVYSTPKPTHCCTEG